MFTNDATPLVNPINGYQMNINKFYIFIYFWTDAHHATLNNLLRELVEGIEEHFGKALHHVPAYKRNAFTDLHGNVGQRVAAFVQPHIDGLKRVWKYCLFLKSWFCSE